MILGIGTDLVSLARIEKLMLRFGEKFIKRILTPKENEHFNNASNPVSYLAKRFAAKEAVAKAFGTGIGEHFAFNEISVTNLDTGQPFVEFIGKSKEYVEKSPMKSLHISLSDEKAFALAFVVMTK